MIKLDELKTKPTLKFSDFRKWLISKGCRAKTKKYFVNKFCEYCVMMKEAKK